MKLMGEFPKKISREGEKGGPLPLTMGIHSTTGEWDRPKLDVREYGGKF